VTYGSDGAKQVVVIKANLFRDAKGRIRMERFYDGTSDPLEETPTDILIDDNCGTSVTLLPGAKIAKVQKMAPPSRVSNRPCCQEVDPKDPPQPSPEGKFEDLGHKFIDGEITTVITDVRQVELDPDLFEIPKDYKITGAQNTSSDSKSKQTER
jgi:hypothetical protein